MITKIIIAIAELIMLTVFVYCVGKRHINKSLTGDEVPKIKIPELLPIEILNSSFSVIAGEVDHEVWLNKNFINKLALKVDKIKFRIGITDGCLDYDTLIDSQTNKSTKYLEWYVKNKLELYKVPKTKEHFKLIDNEVVSYHITSEERKDEREFIWTGATHIINGFRRKFDKLLELGTKVPAHKMLDKFAIVEIQRNKSSRRYEKEVSKYKKNIIKREINRLLGEVK